MHAASGTENVFENIGTFQEEQGFPKRKIDCCLIFVTNSVWTLKGLLPLFLDVKKHTNKFCIDLEAITGERVRKEEKLT